MIRINLLPQSEKPKAPTKAPLIVVGVLIIVLAICAVFYSILNSKLNSVNSDIAALQKRKADLEPKMKAQQIEIAELERKTTAIKQLSGQERFLWSKKLNELAIIVPDNVKFTHIGVSNKESKSYLRLEGVTYAKDGEDRVALIAKLMDALKSKDFYDKPDGTPNFGEIEFVQATSSDEAKDSGLLVDNFIIQIEII